MINQMANYALLEWPDNISISDDAPSDYMAALRTRFSLTDMKAMHESHALPDGWETMTYEAFLSERRSLMAAIIRRGYQKLI